MHIQSVIIDGFKSYPHRTVIQDFDRHFNAITGLNGSGKSNILDAICFVLGITHLNLVRVDSMQGFVYKKGQGGVTRASVTVVFCNDPPDPNLPQYENYPEITVTRSIRLDGTASGTSKYTINGHNAQASKVKNLFLSVSLNVNNPHFLIMQGRIMQIVNMKPPEIVSLLEEAAGTNMFEINKQTALKKIAKKQTKVNEYTEIAENEIKPKLEKLKEDRKGYDEWNQNNKEIEGLERKIVAYEYTSTMEAMSTNATSLQEFDSKLEAIASEKSTASEESEKIQTVIDEELRKKSGDGSMAKLESEVSTLATNLVTATTNHEHANSELKKKEEDLTKAESHITELDKQKETLVGELEEAETDLGKVRTNAEELKRKFEGANEHYQAALTGAATTTDNEDAQSWADKVQTHSQRATSANSEQKQLRNKITHLKKTLAQAQKDLKKTGQQSGGLQEEFERLSNEASVLKRDMDKMDYDENSELNLKKEMDQLVAGIKRSKQEISMCQSKLSRYDPHTSVPAPYFKGVLFQLVDVGNPQKDALALHFAAGGGLYHLVVDSTSTGEKVLAQSKRRVNIIPLDKIKANIIPKETIAEAQKCVGKENANLALQLIGKRKDVQPALDFVFGNTLVCPTVEQATRVAFHPKIRKKVVTLDGQVVDPQGRITGGTAIPVKDSPLLQISQLRDAETTLEQLESKVNGVKSELVKMKSFKEKQEAYLLKKHEADLLQERLQSTTVHQLIQRVKELQEEIDEAEQNIIKLQQVEAEELEKVAELKAQKEDSQSHRETQMKKLEKNIRDAKKALDKGNRQLKEAEKRKDTLELELKEVTEEIESCRDEINTLSEAISVDKEKVEELSDELSECVDLYNRKKAQLDEMKEEKERSNKHIQQLQAKKNQLLKRIEDLGIEEQKVEHSKEKLKNAAKNADEVIEHLREKHKWIEAEQSLFGKAGTLYDFESMDMKAAKKRLENLRRTQEKLSKSINRKVVNMFESAQEQYDELSRKIQIINQNRENIEEFISSVEVKKTETLNKAWESVNRDFGSIFSTLLPGWTSKLEPIEDKPLTEGLRILFARDGVWKEGLSELSGGQKSLLALSLILALLRLKPAPVYILDEVDSALDLSNTQNIGKMLKKHFPQSQFIVVSLKEGMWNNANVLYQVKFVDGASQVTRRTPGGRK